jgi:hypothetical protein
MTLLCCKQNSETVQAHPARVLQPPATLPFAGLEGTEEVGGDPGMPLQEGGAHHHGVHDGEDPSPSEVGLLHLGVVLEQAADRGVSPAVGGQDLRVDDRVQLPAHQHAVDVPAGRYSFQPDPTGCEVQGQVLLVLSHPPDGPQVQAVVVLQNAADPEARGVLEGTQSHPTSPQVPGLPHGTSRAHEDVPVAEAAVGENRDGGEAVGAVAVHQVGCQGELAHVELLVAQHPPVPLGGGEPDDYQVDPLRPHLTVPKGLEEVVVAAGQAELEAAHGATREPGAVPAPAPTA